MRTIKSVIGTSNSPGTNKKIRIKSLKLDVISTFKFYSKQAIPHGEKIFAGLAKTGLLI